MSYLKIFGEAAFIDDIVLVRRGVEISQPMLTPKLEKKEQIEHPTATPELAATAKTKKEKGGFWGNPVVKFVKGIWDAIF